MRRSLFVTILLVLLPGTVSSEGQNINFFEQTVAGSIDFPVGDPLAEGLAGAFTGVHNDVLIIAGGSNFPEKKPWEGGVRIIHDRILAVRKTGDGPVRAEDTGVRLPLPLSDGASVTLPDGVLCIGGQTPSGLSADVFLLSLELGEIKILIMPPLPVALRGHKASRIGHMVYVAGGETEEGPSPALMSLNLNDTSGGWTGLPDMPLAVKDFMFVTQTNGEVPALYAIGGRIRERGEPLTRFVSGVFRYRPAAGMWEERGGIILPDKGQVNIAAAAAAPSGASHIIIIGGDTGEVFNLVEKAINDIEEGKTEAAGIRDSLWKNHPGFNRSVLAYNTITDVWFRAGEWEGQAPAVTSAVWWDGRLFIPGGETAPGIRTPSITSLTVRFSPQFGWINYMILILYFAAMLWIGFYFMNRGKDTDDFFKAGGRIPWWAAGISIFATTLSAITFIAIPAKAYASDWRMLTFNLCIIMVVPVVIRYYLPFFRRLNLNTAYEYLEMRFNRMVRWLASGLFVIFMVSRISIVLFLPSLALHAVTGFSVYWSIIIMGVITIIYCTSGGIEAVVWGDVIQGFILVTGALMAFVFMIYGVEGGIGGFIDVSSEYRKFHMFDLRLDFTQPVLWVVVIGGLANSLILYTSDQSVVQRYMTTKNEKATSRGIWLNGILSIPVSIVFFLLGTGLFAFYYFNPERLALTNPNIDATFPQFIVGELPAGMAGLLISAIFAAAMSTLSSNINSVAAVITSDFFRLLFPRAGTRGAMLTARMSGVVVGVTGIGMALMLATREITSLWDQFNTFLGLLTGGLAALFIMGIFFKNISGTAALAGVLGGMSALVYIQMNTTLSFLLYGAVGMSLSLLLALLLSLVFPNKKDIRGFTYLTKINATD